MYATMTMSLTLTCLADVGLPDVCGLLQSSSVLIPNEGSDRAIGDDAAELSGQTGVDDLTLRVDARGNTL